MFKSLAMVCNNQDKLQIFTARKLQNHNKCSLTSLLVLQQRPKHTFSGICGYFLFDSYGAGGTPDVHCTLALAPVKAVSWLYGGPTN